MRLKEFTPVLPVVFLIFVFVALFYIGDDLGFTDMDTQYLQVLPGLILFVVGVIMLSTTNRDFSLPALVIIGVGLAWLFGTLDTMDMISDQLKAGLTIDEIQLWIILIFTLAGGITTAFKRR